MQKINKIAKKIILEQKIKEIVIKEIEKVNLKISTFSLPFDYKIELSETDISDEDYVGQAMFSEQYDYNILPVAINFKILADEFFMSNNIEYIKNEVRITLWHEAAHGLIEHIQDDGYNIPFDYNNESVCESFGKSKGDLNKSELGKWIKQFNWQINEY